MNAAIFASDGQQTALFAWAPLQKKGENLGLGGAS